MATIVRVYNYARQPIGDLPECVNLTQQITHNGVGVLSGSYPRSGINADLLALPVAYLAVVEDGVVQPDWHILEDDGDNDNTDPNRPIQFAARSMLAMNEWALVWPQEHSGSSLSVNKMNPVHKFVKATPGAIVKALINKAKARGALDDLTFNFTETEDSAGNPWPVTHSMNYAAGTDHLQVLMHMVEHGWIDVKTTGFQLNMYVPGKASVDRKDIIYRGGKDFTQTSQSRSRRSVRNVILGVGEGTNLHAVQDASSVASFGRREGLAADGRMTTTGSLPTMTAKTLSDAKAVKDVLALTVPVGDRGVPGEKIWQPNKDFFVGDYVYVTNRRANLVDLQKLQVKTISFTWATADQGATCVIEFNDSNTKWSVSASRRISKVATAAIKPYLPNTSKPVVTDLTRRPGGVVGPSRPIAPGTPALNTAAMTFVATPSAVAEDNSDIDPPSRYEYQWKYADGPGGVWSPPAVSDSPEFTVTGLEPTRQVQVQVRSVMDGDPPLVSEWVQTAAADTVPDDTTPPQKPSLPTVTARLGTVTVSWDAKGADGAEMPPDFLLAEVHAGTADGFATSSATRRGEIYAASGTTVLSDLPYGSTFVRLVAVDTSGNRSVPSDTATVDVKALVDTDVIGKVLDGTKVIDLSVDGATALKAGSVTTSRLDVGALGENKVPNPYFEEPDPADPTRPAAWSPSWWIGTTPTVGFETADPIQGSASMRLVYPTAGDKQDFATSDYPVPVEEGEQWLLSVKVRCSRAVPAGKKAKFDVWLAYTREDLLTIFNTPASIQVTAAAADLDTEVTTLTGTITVPAGYKWMTFALVHDAPDDAEPSGSGYDAEVMADNPTFFLSGAQDASGNGHNVTVVGSPASTTLPNGDSAYAFDGATQYVEVADANDLSVTGNGGILTIEASGSS